MAARNVVEQDVGVGGGRAKEQGTDEGHDDGVARAFGPNRKQGEVFRMDDDFAVVEVGKPGKDGDKERQQLPEVNVERLGRR